MAESTEKWQGVRIETYDTGEPDMFRVTFFPRFLQGVRGLNGETKKVQDPARVLVRVDSEPQVVRYAPPEIELEGISQKDYERKAIEEVRARHAPTE